MLNFEMWVQN